MTANGHETEEPKATLDQAAVERPAQLTDQDCPIVGIGASAGGLAAFEAFFSGMPPDADPGMAFVLVQHLAPDHKSIHTDLIRRYTRNVIEGAVITFVNISETKKAQAAMQEVALRIAALVRDSLDAILVHDLQGRIMAWNPGATTMYGWSEAEALSMNIRELIAEPEREEALSVVRRFSQSEILQPYRTRRIAKDGRAVEVTLTATAPVNKTGKVYAIATTERRVKAEDHV
jgi:PAS domain S-box-containing protein